MNLGRWRVKRRERRRRRAAADARRSVPLREFVYLDEVSVFSLLASRIGPLATEFTATESSTLASEVHASGGLSVGARAEVGSRLTSSGTSESQVVRKSIVQTTFRELMDYERETLVLREPPVETDPPSTSSADAATVFGDGKYAPWILDPSSLKRGELVELTVELETDPIFRVSAAAAAVLDVLEGNSEIAAGSPDLKDAVAVKRVLDHLLTGLVPLRGRCIDWFFVTLHGESRLVHRRVIQLFKELEEAEVLPVFLVGVAEMTLFWKDIRRVVFSNSRFQMLCRISRDGIQPRWSPVKLADVLRSVAPEVGRQVEDAGEVLLAAMAEAIAAEGQHGAFPLPLAQYASELAAKHGGTDEDASAALSALSDEERQSTLSVASGREAFDHVRVELQARLGVSIARDEAAAVRSNILTGAFASAAPPFAGPARTTPEEARFIDSEIVAIYW